MPALVATNSAIAPSAGTDTACTESAPASSSPNVCTPSYLATTARKLAKDYKFEVEVLERKQLEALRMGSFLSVTGPASNRRDG